MLLCGACNGSGEGMYDGSRCSECKGTGGSSLEYFSVKLNKRQLSWIDRQLETAYSNSMSWESVALIVQMAYKKGIQDGMENS